jgi:protein-tyrosine phosphatase
LPGHSPYVTTRRVRAGIDLDRHVRLDGCCNFRDLGGYGTVDGFTIRTGQLFRADGPRGVTCADTVTLNGLGLATIIDLRTGTEADEHGRYASFVSGAVEYHLPMTDSLPDSDELAGWSDPKVVAAHYRELLIDGHEAICEVLAILTDPAAYPLLVHCSAGKDRTGVLSAIILGMLGVPDDSIIADYALSGPAMVRLVDSLLKSYPDAQEQITQVAPAMTAAEPATMQWFLAMVRAEHESFAGYIESVGMESAVPHARACLLTH